MLCMKLNVKNKEEVKNMIDDLVEKETFISSRKRGKFGWQGRK